MSMIRYRSIEEIKETLENAKSRRRGCVLLIGAGCSVKAGIPTAAGFVEIIKEKYPHAFERASKEETYPTYPKCMAQLLLSERRDLIAQYIDAAQINWAHLCIALLIQAGYVDRVLTTNFDLLVARACAMLGVFPATYDFATSQLLKKPDIPDQAVFNLHGQRTGFVLMNTTEDLESHSKLLGPVFEEAGSGRVWIVVGYSGENDPVFDHLACIPVFDNGLFWIGYGNNEPASHIREKLLTQNIKDAFFTQGFDADSFFVSLTRKLGIFPPDLLVKPFSYLQRTLTHITPFVDPGQTFEDDVMRTPRDWIRTAIDQFEFEMPAWENLTRGERPEIDEAKRAAWLTIATRYLLMQGRYEQVLTFRKDFDEYPSADLAGVLSMAYVMSGNQLLDNAKAKVGAEAEHFFNDAKKMYEAALAIKPDRHEALHNWGNLLLDLAKTKTNKEEADRLFSAAEEKYHAALIIKPDRYEVLVNWGNLLLDQAKTNNKEKADALFMSAEEKYKAALAIKPGMPDILLNWGNLLLDQAKSKIGEEADFLFTEAEMKYKAALEIKPDMPEAFYQWGNVLLDRAKSNYGKEIDPIFREAIEKYRAALTIKPEMYEALNNWGNLLVDQGKTKSGQEADELFTQAREKYTAALTIKPDMYEVLNNWGNLLVDQGKTKNGQEADELFTQAREKYTAALTIKPDMYEVLNNWGNLLLDRKRVAKPSKIFLSALISSRFFPRITDDTPKTPHQAH